MTNHQIFDNKELHPWRLDSFFPVWGPQNPNSIEVWKVMAIEDSKPLNSGQISLHASLDHCIFQNLLILFVHIELGTKSLLSQHETMTRLFYYHYYWRSGSGERMPCCLRHKKTCVGSEHLMTIMEPCNNWVCLNIVYVSQVPKMAIRMRELHCQLWEGFQVLRLPFSWLNPPFRFYTCLLLPFNPPSWFNDCRPNPASL